MTPIRCPIMLAVTMDGREVACFTHVFLNNGQLGKISKEQRAGD